MYFVQRTALPRLGQEEAESWSWPGLELVTGHESQNTTESEAPRLQAPNLWWGFKFVKWF